jgi:GTPase
LSEAEAQGRPLVALIGRPNVGKSSLFNRLVGGRPALVEDLPGVTRDRRYGVCDWNRGRFRVVDTGGLDPSAVGILGAMRAQTLRALDEGDLLCFVVDAREGITSVDEEVARLLRKTGKPVMLVANKVDSTSRDAAAAEAFSLGWNEVFPISATHGRGVGEMLDAMMEKLGARAAISDEQAAAAADQDTDLVLDDDTDDEDEEIDEEDEDGPPRRKIRGDRHPDDPIRLAFVGKPNVGKSSLLNRLLGEERVLVHHEPGTTRDPIDTPFRLGDQRFVLVDTAGMRRRRAVDTLTEAVAAKMARDQLARADVAAMVIDIQTGATAEDAKLGSLIDESGRGALIVLNKSDLIPRAELDSRVKALRETLSFMSYAKLVMTSARTGRGVLDIPKEAVRSFGQWSRRVGTADLNRHFEEIVTKRPPPAGPGGRHVRLYYATQADICPPTFYVSANQPKAVGQPYRRYLTNQIRLAYGFEGSPIRVFVRGHSKKKSAGA